MEVSDTFGSWVQVVLAAAVVYILFKIEYYYKLWRYRRLRRKAIPKLSSDHSIKGLVSGAATSVPCSDCGGMFVTFYEYADGTRRCAACHDKEE